MRASANAAARALVPELAWLRRRLGSIRVRLALWYLTIMSALLLFFGGLLVTTLMGASPYYSDQMLLQLGEQLASTYQLQTGQVRVPHPLPDASDVVVVIGVTGEVTQTVGPISPEALAALRGLVADAQDASLTTTSRYPLATSTAGASAYDVQTIAVLRQGRRVATLILATPSGAASGRVPLRSVWPGLLGLLTLVTAGAGGYWLVTRALRPVHLVTQTAREISVSDLSRRLNVTSSDELGELAATFDQMLGRLDEAFARQRRFTADASHELRAPLTVIQLEAARMLEQPSTHMECLDALDQIRRTTAAMALLVDDLLVLARFDDGAVRREVEEFDLSDRAYELAERLVPLAHQRHLQLLLGNLPELPMRGDRRAIDRMIGNVVENAIKYAAGVGHQVTIETGQRVQQGELWGWMEVADDGPGIAADQLPHIFDRFYRTDPARTPGGADDEAVPAPAGAPVTGSGLGLAIARSVATAHGGEIQMHSAPGQGCQVTILLPLVRSMPSATTPAMRQMRLGPDTLARRSEGSDVRSESSHSVAPIETG